MVKMEDCGGQMLVIAAPIQIWRFRFPEMVVTQNGWFTMDNPIQNGWFRGTTFLGNIHVSYIKYVIIQIIPMFVVWYTVSIYKRIYAYGSAEAYGLQINEISETYSNITWDSHIFKSFKSRN